MSESKEAASSGSEGNGAAIDPVALALALDGASRERADSFLMKQEALIAAQLHHLHEQMKQIHLDIFEKWLGVALRLATLCVGIAVAAGGCLMVWDAAHSNGLLIEPFAVPPDLAEKGLTGQVIASQVQDKLTAMQAGSVSFRPVRSYANNWGNDIKVEIPETGVSIGEVRRFLRDWLGNDTHISGEVWHTDTGLAISARTGGERGATFTGATSDIDALVQKAAEHVLDQTQSYRYAIYLRQRRRIEESRAVFARLTTDPSREERGWAWQGLATLPTPTGSSDQESDRFLRKAIAVYPDYTLGYASLAFTENAMSHAEAALAAARTATNLVLSKTVSDIDPLFLSTARANYPRLSLTLTGDFAEVIRLSRSIMELPDRAGAQETMRQGVLTVLGQQHDGKAMREYWRQLPPAALPTNVSRRAIALLQGEAAAEHWSMVLALAGQVIRSIDETSKLTITGPSFDRRNLLATQIQPWVALAKARLGDPAGAEAAIASTPGDCYDCVRVRGMIAAQARQWERADWWFAKAVHDGPSLPFAYTDWGIALLKRGQPDKAIEKFTIASRKGPHFADPLEGWGEALMAKNQSHRTLLRFAQAAGYAPNWGRLHLKWGEALVYAGKRDEARRHFARAAELDLTEPEKAELAARSQALN